MWSQPNPSCVCVCLAEVQGSVWEGQGPDQHGPWGFRDPRRQGGLQEHQQRESPQRMFDEGSNNGSKKNPTSVRDHFFMSILTILAGLQEEIRGH